MQRPCAFIFDENGSVGNIDLCRNCQKLKRWC